MLSFAACGKKPANSPGSQNPGVNQESELGNNPDTSAVPKVTIYFSDDQSMNLVPEVREVSKGKDETMESAVIRELIKGPANKNLGQVIPDGTKLLSSKVVDGVAYVDFSKEFRDNHWGGSAGETMTIYAVVDSLCKLPGIKKVQFLLEGNKQESILNGNMDTSVPIEPDYSLVKQ
ncbi:GerMN domain-containing protein [Desulfotruncus alcoholivorax]|uniref:GerMN domain-containing protein n=1 Tax=Desulfotruncus alcoholivorax TaxID=265477 RepID=UPI001A992708|nr:GerMN domain-containing protein [Desulfotruncus alcoholivorax]